MIMHGNPWPCNGHAMVNHGGAMDMRGASVANLGRASSVMVL